MATEELDPFIAMMSDLATPNYSTIYHLEKEFDYADVKIVYNKYWSACFYLAAFYVLAALVGQKWMTNRTRYELRVPLVLWNLMLATFSIAGAFRTIPEIYHVINQFGLYHSVCIPNYIVNDKVISLWTTLFILSKAPELVDTIFVVLRKQPLIFLHWYHHATVLLYSWYSFVVYTAPSRWFITMNYSVHSIMYSYYFLKAMQIRVPRFVSMVITAAQLGQMAIGCAVNIWAYQLKQSGVACNANDLNIQLSLLMYFSYLILFAHFFYKAYINKSSSPKKGMTEESNKKKK